MLMQPVGVLVVEDAASQAAHPRSSRVDALERIANRPIAALVLDGLADAGVSDVVVVVAGTVAREVREALDGGEPGKHALRLRFVERPGQFDFTAALHAAAPLVGDAPCIIHPPAGLLAEPLTPLVDRLSPDAPEVVVLADRRGEDGRGSRTARSRGLHLVDAEPVATVAGTSNIWLCGRHALHVIFGEQRRAADGDDMALAAEVIAAAGGAFRIRPVDDWSRYAGDPADLLELNRIALDRLRLEPLPPASRGNRVDGPVRIHPSASVQRSTIIGPVVIGAGARISDAYIGPYTSIAAGAQIEGTELERSIIGPGARLAHVGGRLMSSVVGPHAKVFHDFSLPRALRLRVGDGTEIGLY
jgi:glucose-1-phosphate thymidylyltransferase